MKPSGFITHHAHTSCSQLVFSVGSILVLAKLIEPVWGSKEFITFILVTNTATGACTLVLLYVIFALTQYSEKSGDLL